MQACSPWIAEEEIAPAAPSLPDWRPAIAPRDLKPIVKRDPEGKLPRALPLNRSACADIPRPCPYVSCRYNLYTDVTPRGYLVIRDCEPEDMPADRSCALDLAEDGEHTQEEVGELIGVGGPRVLLIEASALARMRADKRLAELVSD